MFPIQEVRTYCKNYAVNAILSFYAEKAEKNGISMQVTIQMADPPVIPETEFCVLVGNLLENAVDACADTDAEIQSFIRLHVVQTGSSMLSITADNTSSGSPNWSGDKLLSTKHSGYGIGTESIRMIAERYSGDARFRWKDGIFYASVMLNPQV
jgi:sensor histidine kinase regulating citrate/malate metabolism